MDTWILAQTDLDFDRWLHRAPVYTVGNGLFCCRGFWEEEQAGTGGLGGIYMARVFGKAVYKPWKGVGQELVNVPNFFWAAIHINNKPIMINTENIRDFRIELNMREGILTRGYTYCENGQPLMKVVFRRFASRADIFTAGQSITITPLTDSLSIKIECGVNTNITNLNAVSSEPYPVQPGRKQCEEIYRDKDLSAVVIRAEKETSLAFAQRVISSSNVREVGGGTRSYVIELPKGEEAVIKKLVSIALSPDDGPDVEAIAKRRRDALPTFEQTLDRHIAAMLAWWELADIEIGSSPQDQLILRYNILQLSQSCPRHTNRYSIGARGLTGEMYEGSVFWDTEIFMLPFFTMTDPEAARKLLEFRYNTLPEAKRHAESNWFEGAMYGWQVNAHGVEQTPQGVGAYYSIHVVADIAYAILDYWHCTGDVDFILHKGLEILIETARFWVSRITRRSDGKYDIIAVRGPNEYDVLVNNNLYTNMMARENLLICTKLLKRFGALHPAELAEIKARIAFEEAELSAWEEVSENMILPYDKEQDLWLEDDTYLRRKPLDMLKAKPTAKRIIDTTIPYEALPFYQVSKQADVLHVMRNLPWHFTDTQIETAYDFYHSRTAFDSSLAYSVFALMAARLGKAGDAMHYFNKSANLDIDNVQLNTISGLHFANFGGTWQAVVFGFAGVSVNERCIAISPHLPPEWESLRFKLRYHGCLLEVSIRAGEVRCEFLSGERGITLSVCGKDYSLSCLGDVVKHRISEDM